MNNNKDNNNKAPREDINEQNEINNKEKEENNKINEMNNDDSKYNNLGGMPDNINDNPRNIANEVENQNNLINNNIQNNEVNNIGMEDNKKISEIKNGKNNETDISMNSGNSKITCNEELAKLLDSNSCESYNKSSKSKNIYNLIII